MLENPAKTDVTDCCRKKGVRGLCNGLCAKGVLGIFDRCGDSRTKIEKCFAG